MGDETQNAHKTAETLRRQAIERLNSNLTPQLEEPVLSVGTDDGLLLMLKIASAGFAAFCIYVAFRITGDLIVKPDIHDTFVLGIFLAMAGIGFLIWVPKKNQHQYAALLSIFIGVMEIAVNVAIIMKTGS